MAGAREWRPEGHRVAYWGRAPIWAGRRTRSGSLVYLFFVCIYFVRIVASEGERGRAGVEASLGREVFGAVGAAGDGDLDVGGGLLGEQIVEALEAGDLALGGDDDGEVAGAVVEAVGALEVFVEEGGPLPLAPSPEAGGGSEGALALVPCSEGGRGTTGERSRSRWELGFGLGMGSLLNENGRRALGFRFSVVLADSLYGESGPFIAALHRHHLQYVVAIRSNHGVWMLPGQRIRRTRWRPFERVFTDGTSQHRFIRETIFGTRRGAGAPGRALLPDRDRPRGAAPRDDLGPHDQSAGQDRADGGQHLRVHHCRDGDRQHVPSLGITPRSLSPLNSRIGARRL